MSKHNVYVVDDDQAVRDSLRWLIESVDLNVKTFSNGQELLDNFEEQEISCLVLDVRMPGISGLDLQQRLKKMGSGVPVIIVTGHADVPMAIQAMKAGAFDFIEKPYSDQLLLERIQCAIEQDDCFKKQQVINNEINQRIDSLTPREREVMGLVVSGHSNKSIAKELGVSIKTVEVHRGNLMTKMQAKSLSELVRLVMSSSRTTTKE
ncbi:MAG: response regulator transcription factor [Gammaproteobacteria bacterium]|nr:response regulator transcription factor [Gammaproteobacteria bacterium]